MKIIFLISSLHKGGAELQLATLANLLKQRGHDIKVAVSYTGGYYDNMLKEGGVPIIDLKKSSKWDLGFYIRLYSTLRRERPEILHSYLPSSNISASLVGLILRRIKIVWGIRASNMDLRKYSKLNLLLHCFEPYLSKRADLIISNSESAKKLLLDRGFGHDKIRVVCNGIDTSHFRPQKDKGKMIKNRPVTIGTAARIDPMKGYEIFIEAVKLFYDTYPDLNIEFIAAGGRNKEYMDEIMLLAEQLGISGKIIWLGEQNDMASIYNRFDVYTSTSLFGEGFSNSICEAMACEVPCVVTNVGDSAKIVGDTGIVVEPGDSKALMEAWYQMVNSDLDELGHCARLRIQNNFGLEKLAESSERVLKNILSI